jgi:hypothetical protein
MNLAEYANALQAIPPDASFERPDALARLRHMRRASTRFERGLALADCVRSSMRPCLPIAVAAIAAMLATMAAGSFGARAEEADDGLAKRLFAGDIAKQQKSYACFVRVYDAAYLAHHPQQKVGAMKLLVRAETMPETEALNYSFRLGVKLRDRRGQFDSGGDCGRINDPDIAHNTAQLGCGVDCDGGGITIELPNDGKSTKVGLESIRIWRIGKTDDDGLTLSGGKDDRMFRLDRAGLDKCRSLVIDSEELAAMRLK